MAIEHNLPTDQAIKQMFDAVPLLERYSAGDRAVRAAAKVVLQRARQLTPQGDRDDAEARSADQKASGDWSMTIRRAMSQKVVKYPRGNAGAFVGPRFRKNANKEYFFTSPTGREVVEWGRRTGETVPEVRNWIVQAFDETRPLQLEAMRVSLVDTMRNLWGK